MKIKDLYEKINDGVIKSDIELQRDIVYNNKKDLSYDLRVGLLFC